jgi:Putative Actinobacterial Holin-X, holin superfamily III
VNAQRERTDLRDKHIGELISQLGSETATLVRQEMALARAELAERVDLVRSELDEAVEVARAETAEKLDQARRDLGDKGKKAGVGIGMFGAAGVATLLALGALTACLILVLDRWLPRDLAALVVGIAWALVAAAAALRGRDKVRDVGGFDAGDYVPWDTIDTVKRDLGKGAVVKQLVPEQTIETVKEDVEWAKTPRRSATR